MDVWACEGNRSICASRVGGNGGEEGMTGSSINETGTDAGNIAASKGGLAGRAGLGANVGFGGTFKGYT